MAKRFKSSRRFDCRVDKLMIAITVAVFLGVTAGLCLRLAHLNIKAIEWIKIWGELFIRMFSALTLPIILSCIIVGIAGLEGRKSGILGLVTVIFMLYTTFFCVLIAIMFHFIIRPGQRAGHSSAAVGDNQSDQSGDDIWFDILRNLIPDNLVSASVETVYTSVIKEEVKSNLSNLTNIQYMEKKVLKRRAGINSLGMVVIAVAFACAIRSKGEKAKPIKDFFEALSEIVFSLVDIVMWYAPLGICCMIAGAFLAEENLFDALKMVLFFVITNIAAYAVHAFVLLPVTYLVVVRKNPLWFYTKIADAIVAGLAPPSSVVAMTILLEKAERKFETKPDVVNVVLPVSVVLIKNGSTLFICISIFFMADSQKIPLTAASIVMIGCLVAILTAAVPNIPSGSIFIIILVASVMQIPIQDSLGHLYTVEWLLDRLRTSNNTCGSAFAVPVIDKIAQMFYFERPEEAVEGVVYKQCDKETLLGKECIVDIDSLNHEKSGALICDQLTDCPETIV